MSETHVTGLKALNDMLQSLPVKIEKNILRGALRAGTNVVKKEAQKNLAANGNVVTGELSKGLRVSTNSKGGTVTAKLKTKGKHGHVGVWLEMGTAPHVIVAKADGALAFGDTVTQSVQHPGTSPSPFMRPALDGRAGAAVVAAAEHMKKRLTKEGLAAGNVAVAEV